MPDQSIEILVQALARLPGLGPRSARRAVLQLVKRRESLMDPLLAALQTVRDTITTCSDCGNIDVADPCHVCTDPRRDRSRICVVEEVADLWALERGGIFNGLYHILGGVLSALDGVGPDDLRIPRLISRCRDAGVSEVILATSATVDGQTTAFYIADHLADCQVTVSGLAHGVPIGGELDYLDDGTLATALRERRPMGR